MENNKNTDMKSEIKDEELENVSGGVQEPRNTVQKCPICGNNIPINMLQLMDAKGIDCSVCGWHCSLQKR